MEITTATGIGAQPSKRAIAMPAREAWAIPSPIKLILRVTTKVPSQPKRTETKIPDAIALIMNGYCKASNIINEYDIAQLRYRKAV